MRKRVVDKVPVDNFYCTVDSWKRNFWFHVDRLKHLEGLSPKEHGFGEYDTLTIIGTIRHHSTDKKTRNRVGQKLELKLWPTHTPRSEWRMEPEAIGGVQTSGSGISATGFTPSDAYYSLFPCLSAGVFKEMCLRVRNLRYRHGDLDGVNFDPELTPMEDF